MYTINNNTVNRWIGLGAVMFIGASFVATGCSSSKSMDQNPVVSDVAPLPKSGAELWAENCVRCHNIRDPQSLSDAQWSVAMQHMRLRANLLADEHAKIEEFLKISN